jgi:hypothetical protein
MKTQDGIVLFVLGFIIWILGSVYYAYRGPSVLETTSLRYWISFFISPLVSAIICIVSRAEQNQTTVAE